ncbi:MAG: hypothetical protein IKE55_06295, partial [Kiritimatiellae bacterium]|nr:hypothetical protein [Kiritimatiellia bacterium]
MKIAKTLEPVGSSRRASVAGAFLTRLLVAAAAITAAAVAKAKGCVGWSGIEPHPAVVNPVCGYKPGTVIDLCGEWTFTAVKPRPDRAKMPYADKWPGERRISVPGAWQWQGVGSPSPLPARCCYGGHSRGRFPLKHSFIGNGWYRREVDIPEEWRGKRIWLKVGCVGSQGWFWVNDMPVAHVYDFCATRKYEITAFVKPGEKAKIVAEATNALPSKRGSSEAAGCWGGLLRGVELEATPTTHIDDAWVRGDFDAKCAEVHVFVDSSKPIPGGMALRANVEGSAASQPAKLGENVLRVPLADFRPWDPENPNLYVAEISLCDGSAVLQTRGERFGVRKLEVRGKDFYLNGKPFFVRGCGFHDVNPIHGYLLPDRGECRRLIGMVRKAGFNFARLHTRCESPEFFEVADELGLMLQAELPYYGDYTEDKNPFEPIEDAQELCENFRRYVSLSVYCGGNESNFGPTLGAALYRKFKQMDPDRLVIEQDSMAQPVWKRAPKADGKDEWRGVKVAAASDLANYRVEGYDDFVGYPNFIWERGSLNPPCPLVAHEYMNVAVKADSRLADRYVGIWDHTVDRGERGRWLARFGLSHAEGDRLQDAQHRFQAIWLKRGIEAARKDPHCDGYYFWSVTDCIFSNEKGWTGVVITNNPCHIAQGLFSPFMDEKINGMTAADFARFNSPRGVFIDCEPDENMHFVAAWSATRPGPKIDVFFANYGEAPLANPSCRWSLTDKASGIKLQGGTFSSTSKWFSSLGKARKIYTIFRAADLPKTQKPVAVAADLKVEVCDGDKVVADNAWDCWIFPERKKRDGSDIAVVGSCAKAFGEAFDGLLPPERASEAKVVVADFGSPAAEEALARGQSVIEIGGTEGKVDVNPSWWFIKGVVGAYFNCESPLLKHLPRSEFLSTLHFRTLKRGILMPVRGFRTEDLVAVSERDDGCYAHLGDRVDPRGGRHLFAFGIEMDASLPESVAIMDGLVERARDVPPRRPLPERSMYFATHFHNWYEEAPDAEVVRYIEELAEWGLTGVAAWFDMHDFSGMDDPAAKRRLERLKLVFRTAK